MGFLRSLAITPVFALATLTVVTLPGVPPASASVYSPSACFSSGHYVMPMTLTTQSGKVYHYLMSRSGADWEICPESVSSPIVATGTSTSIGSRQVQFNEAWPAANSYGIATVKVQQLKDRYLYVGSWYFSDGAVEAFRAVFNL
jgi:hypothetical protein